MAEDDTVLDLIGVDQVSERIYGFTLREGATTVAAVAQYFGLTVFDAAERLDELRALGLVAQRATDHGDYAPVDPRFSLRVLTDRHSNRIARIRERIGTLAEHFDSGRTTQPGSPQTHVIYGADAVAAWYVRLQHQAGTEFLAFDRPPYVSAPSSPLEPVVLDRGVAWRAVYAAASFEYEGSWEAARELVERGEQARVASALPVKLAIADRSVALVSLTLDGDTVDALVTESPSLVRALCELFEHHWDRATPIPASGLPLDAVLQPTHPTDRRRPTREEAAILTLIGAGVKDDVIARQLGMSPRTLRRRSQDLMVDLGAANRFQAGAEAARRGWI